MFFYDRANMTRLFFLVAYFAVLECWQEEHSGPVQFPLNNELDLFYCERISYEWGKRRSCTRNIILEMVEVESIKLSSGISDQDGICHDHFVQARPALSLISNNIVAGLGVSNFSK